MTEGGGKVVTSYRVSCVRERFVLVVDWPGTTHPRRWALLDETGPSVAFLEVGRGDPPARFFPLGIVPAWAHEEAREG